MQTSGAPFNGYYWYHHVLFLREVLQSLELHRHHPRHSDPLQEVDLRNDLLDCHIFVFRGLVFRPEAVLMQGQNLGDSSFKEPRQ